MKEQRVLAGAKPVILADVRENGSYVINHLRGFDAEIATKQLEVGDYICSKDVVCERKTVNDFLSSITDSRLVNQLQLMVESYPKPILLVEGNPELLYSESGIHENAIRGVLAKVAVDFRVPILWTANSLESAKMIYRIAYREQVKKSNHVTIRSAKKPESTRQIQEFLVSGLPSVNSTLSKRLLDHFKTPKELFNATQEELMKVDKIGKEKARKIWEVLNSGQM